MSFLLTHIASIVILAVIIAGIACIWAFLASHNAKQRDPEMQKKQDSACETCSLASMCTRFGGSDTNCDGAIKE